MKPCNFPARKLARQIAAKEGGSCRFYADNSQVQQAQNVRTKKRRASV